MIRLRPTELGCKGLTFYGLLMGAFFAAPYANLLFLLLAFLTLLGIGSIIGAVRNLRRLQARVAELPATPAAIEARLAVIFEAPQRPRWALDLALDFKGELHVRLPLEVAEPGDVGAARMPPLVRGVYGLRRARLCSCWPLGLWRVSVPVAAPAEFVVYPQPAERSVQGSSGAGEDPLASLTTAQGAVQPSGLREYQPGDEPRRVHWKASARRTTLVVTEWEAGRGSGHEVVLDRRGNGEVLELNLRRLTALALEAQAEKETLTLHTQGLSHTFDSGQTGFQMLWRFLAAAEALPEDAAAPAPASPDALILSARTGACS